VLSTSFAWSNTRPAEDERSDQEATIRESPIVLNASMQLRFLDRISLVDSIDQQVSANETSTTL
jgi:hypothetical protein